MNGNCGEFVNADESGLLGGLGGVVFTIDSGKKIAIFFFFF